MKRVLYILIVYCLSACLGTQDKALEQALLLSGQNRSELEAVLNHYKDDSLKLRAACYLIRNMPYHYSMEEYYCSPDGNKYRPDIASFEGKEAVNRHCDSLLRCGYRIEQHKLRDITSLDSTFLVENIDLAFSVWQKPWARNVSFDDFCRYILPYRSQTEEASSLRKEMMETFVPMLDSARVTTPLEACIFLNKRLSKVIRYQETGLSFYPTIDETYRAGINKCDGICNLGVFIMRAAGIPVTLDFTTWVKMDLGHSWCAVLDGGHFYSFGPGEDQPDVHARIFSEKRHRRPAKVYRFRFDPVVISESTEDDGYVTFLKSPLLYDVTDEYLDKTTCIKVPVYDKNDLRDKQSGQAYLCVYNFYEWQPIAVGTCSDEGMCVFDNVVGDNIFMVADCPDGKTLRYITAPFYVSTTGGIRTFVPQMQRRETFVFKKNSRKPSQKYTLSYWDVIKKCFVELSCKEECDSTQVYDQIPENALLWFTIPERVVNQRVFFIENDSIKKY